MDYLTFALLFVIFASLGLLVLMIGLRGVRKLHEQHLARLDHTVRPRVLALTVAESDELDRLIQDICALNFLARQRAGQLTFRMLTEVSGESQHNLATLMSALGAVEKAQKNSRSFSSMRRAHAAELLGLVKPPHALEIVTKLAADQNREVRIVAVRALGRLNNTGAITQLERILLQPRTVPSWIAGSALLDVDIPVDFVLSKYLGHPAPVVRQIAVTIASLRPRPDTVSALGKCVLDDTDRLVRVMAARALGRIQSRAGIEPLTVAALSDPNKSVRVAAAQALALLPAAWTRDVMVYLRSTSMDSAVQRAALPAPRGLDDA